MLDIRSIREDPEKARAAARLKRIDPAPIDRALLLDEGLRKLKTEIETLKAEQNKGSKEISKLQGDAKAARSREMRALSDRIKEMEPDLARLEQEMEECLLRIP